MDRNTSYSLALCLLAVTAVNANAQDTGSATDTANGIQVPNVPADLFPPDLNAPEPDAAAEPASRDTAQSAETAGDFEAATAPAAQTFPSEQPAVRVPSTRTVRTNIPRERPPLDGFDTRASDSLNVGLPARTAVEESSQWAENPDAMPVRDAAGRVIFPQGSNPTIVCAVFHACDLQLQAGENVIGSPHVGDSIRWKITPAISGAGDQSITHLIIKPTEPGLGTNLIIPTDRTTYHIRLVSSSVHYVTSVAFESSDPQAAWQNLPKAGAASRDSGGSESRNDMPVVAVNRLNFNYKIKVVKGKPAFKPLRAMDDGYRTYIAMNDEMLQGEAPALVGISSRGEEQMVNYRLKGNLYVIDGTIGKLALISGVGRDQQRIELTRTPCRERGWLGICWDPKE
jgi:type IV secretion system protein TrbG